MMTVLMTIRGTGCADVLAMYLSRRAVADLSRLSSRTACKLFRLEAVTQIRDKGPELYGRGVGKRTSHHGPHTGDQVDGFGFHACAIVCCAEAWLGLRATHSDCMFPVCIRFYSSRRAVAGRDVPRARKRSSERTAMALMMRTMTGRRFIRISWRIG